MKNLVKFFGVLAMLAFYSCEESLIEMPVEDLLNQEVTETNDASPGAVYKLHERALQNSETDNSPEVDLMVIKEYCYRDGAVLILTNRSNSKAILLNNKRFNIKWIKNNEAIGEGLILNGCNCGGTVAAIVDDHAKRISYKIDTTLPRCVDGDGS